MRDSDGSFRFLDRMKYAIRRRGENIVHTRAGHGRKSAFPPINVSLISDAGTENTWSGPTCCSVSPM